MMRPVLAALALVASSVSIPAFAQAQLWHELGRPATQAEIKAWDIDVRPDFKGLPAGAGSVSLGEQATLAAILSFLTAHENDLVACADALQVPPATIDVPGSREFPFTLDLRT